MGRVYLEFNNNKWKEVVKSNFWIDRALLDKLDSLKKIQSKAWDGVIIIDGKERSGKSVLGMICGWYLSNTQLTENNFARGLEDAAQKIADAPDGSVIMVDEGSLIFAGKDWAGKEQKKLIKILDVVGQKNLIFIICLPCYFDLNKTIAVRRSLFLLHVYPDADYNRGRYAYWGEKRKKQLYAIGKKNFDSYAFPKAEFVGNFLNFEPPFYKKYLNDVKKESLRQVLSGKPDAQTTEEILRDYKHELAWKLSKLSKKATQTNFAEALGIGRRTFYDWVKIYELKIAQIPKETQELGSVEANYLKPLGYQVNFSAEKELIQEISPINQQII